jgi:hypothetical protein
VISRRMETMLARRRMAIPVYDRLRRYGRRLVHGVRGDAFRELQVDLVVVEFLPSSP